MRIFLLLLTLLWTIVPPSTAAAKEKGLTLIMRVSPTAQFESEYYIEDPSFIKHLMKGEKIKTTEKPELPLAYLRMKNKEKMLTISNSLNIYDLVDQVKWQLSPQLKDQLLTYVTKLKEQHFGEDLAWSRARELLPRMGYAHVVDLETGLSFDVQRRAGSRHADVQPLTAKDSKIMKEIYDGEWSWRRRAILVKTNGHSIAASMNGMPHGAGAISGNNFPGHFCIHFKDSTTHKRNTPDPGHDYMVLKARGDLFDHLVKGNPEELTSLFVSALHEKDWANIPYYFNLGDGDSVKSFIDSVGKIEGIKVHSLKGSPEDGLQASVATVIRLKLEGKKEVKKSVVLHFSRTGPTDRWKLEARSLNEQLWS